MYEISVSQARQTLPQVIDQARYLHEPVYIHKHGKRVAAVIDADDLDRLIDIAEDVQDAAEAQAAIDEGGDPIPWEEVKKNLGL